MYVFERGPIVYEPPGRFGVLNTPVLVYRKTEKFTVIHITIKKLDS